jgi:hypothetical protein
MYVLMATVGFALHTGHAMIDGPKQSRPTGTLSGAMENRGWCSGSGREAREGVDQSNPKLTGPDEKKAVGLALGYRKTTSPRRASTAACCGLGLSSED